MPIKLTLGADVALKAIRRSVYCVGFVGASMALSGCKVDSLTLEANCQTEELTFGFTGFVTTVNNSDDPAQSGEVIWGRLTSQGVIVDESLVMAATPVGTTASDVPPVTVPFANINVAPPFTIEFFNPKGGDLQSDRTILKRTFCAKTPAAVPAVGIPAMLFGALGIFGAVGFLTRRRKQL